jgi:elongation factor G
LSKTIAKEYTVDKVRNIALIGHGGSGKTTLTESLLFVSGSTARMGRVEDGSTISDYHPDEIERKISISAALLHTDWQGTKINILDTPGYSDFTGEVICALRVADLAVVVLKSIEGVEVGSETVWNYAKKLNVPAMIVVNKIEGENADFDRVVETAKERFGHDVVVAQFPVNQGAAFDSVVDLLKMKLLKFDKSGNGKFTESEIPADLKQKADGLHEEFIEKIAETDESLMNKFFEAGTLDENDLGNGLRSALLQRKIFPMLCMASATGMGSMPLLDALVAYAPSPKDRGAVKAISGQEKKEIFMEPDTSKEPSLFVFKTVSEEHVGELSFFRAYSGIIAPGLDLQNQTNGKAERLGQIYLVNGKERQEVAKLAAGDIGAVVKLKDTHTNNTLSGRTLAAEYTPITFPDPVIRMAIKSKVKGEEDRIANGLHALHEEDPTFLIIVDGKLSQTLVAGQGELHLLIMTKRLKQKYGVEVDLVEPKIPYKEAIRAVAADVEYKHKKQTGGRGQYGHVHIKIEPLSRGSGFKFEDAVVGGVVPGRFIPAVEKGVVETMQRGVLAGYEVVDIKVTIFDGSYHAVDSDEHSFKMAGTMAFKKGILEAKPVLLEPINEIEVIVPEEYMGDVMGDLSGRRGKIQGMESEDYFQKIKALVPMSEIHRYSTILRSMTQGRGIFRTKFSHYDEMPKEMADKIIEAHSKLKEVEE